MQVIGHLSLPWSRSYGWVFYKYTSIKMLWVRVNYQEEIGIKRCWAACEGYAHGRQQSWNSGQLSMVTTMCLTTTLSYCPLACGLVSPSGSAAWRWRVGKTVASFNKPQSLLFLILLLLLLFLTSYKSSGSMSALGKREKCHQQLLQASFPSSASAAQSCGLVQTVRAICLQFMWQKDHLSASDPALPSHRQLRLSPGVLRAPGGPCLHSPSPQNWLTTPTQLEKGVKRLS